MTDHDGRFRTDERALSGGDIETIAVVGMLGIVVVMGGAVGAGILLLGDDGDALSMNFSFAYRDSAERLDIYYEQGPAVKTGDILVRVQGESATWANLTGDNSTTIEPPKILNVPANSTLSGPIERGAAVEVVYVDPKSGEQSVVSTWNGTAN